MRRLGHFVFDSIGPPRPGAGAGDGSGCPAVRGSGAAPEWQAPWGCGPGMQRGGWGVAGRGFLGLQCFFRTVITITSILSLVDRPPYGFPRGVWIRIGPGGILKSPAWDFEPLQGCQALSDLRRLTCSEFAFRPFRQQTN